MRAPPASRPARVATRRRVVVPAALLLALSTAACSADDLATPAEPDAPAGLRVSAPVTRVAGALRDEDRLALRRQVEGLLRQYLQAAFLDPDANPGTAYAVFTEGAARLARTRGAILSRADLGADEVSVRRARATVQAYAPAGRAVGATVRLDLTLEAEGALEARAERVRLTGRLLLTPERGTWRVFGFDVRRSRR